MGFSVLSWNVEHFRGKAKRLKNVKEHIQARDPDVLGILEAEGKDVEAMLDSEFGGYDFAITSGRQNQEILVGWKRNVFDQVRFKQKLEFKAYNPYLRPGALLKVSLGGRDYHLLFLHTDSGTKAKDFGNRYEMFDHIWKLRKSIRKTAGSDAKTNLIVLGDLNTMGLFYPVRRKANELITGERERVVLNQFAKKNSMRVLNKSHDETFNNGRLSSDLDHVIASEHLAFEVLGQIDGEDYHVAVDGWNQLAGAARKAFIEHTSDHSSLIVKVT